MIKADGGFFLVIEGLDGSGKTVVARRLAELLEKTHGEERVLLTFEPHDASCAGVFIRQVLMQKIEHDSKTLALAFAANRADHSRRYIESFLGRGDRRRVVICDRYYLSSLVFQSDGSLTSMREIRELNSAARLPDLTIFLEAKDSICRERMGIRAEEKELFETNHRQKRDKYSRAIEFLQIDGENIEVVDANGTIEDVMNQILDKLSMHRPSWLGLQPYLQPPIEAFSIQFNGVPEFKIAHCVEELDDYWQQGSIVSQDGFKKSLLALKRAVDTKIESLSLNDLASLFLDYIAQSGYQFIEELPWTDVIAFGFEFAAPLSVTLYGTVILLDKTKGREILTKKVNRILFSDASRIRKLSDFMLVLHPDASRLINGYYERELVPLRVRYSDIGDAKLTPSTRLFGRADIARWVLSAALASYRKEHFMSLRGLPSEFKRILLDFAEKWSLRLDPSKDRSFGFASTDATGHA